MPVEAEMVTLNPQRAKQLQENVQAVTERISKASDGRRMPRLVCVSKLKPANDILALHQASSPQQHFGENYAQELQAKAQLLPATIRWHMIGALQTNKCKSLAENVRNLWCVASVDAAKKADALDKGRATLEGTSPLRVLVQVNTSGEDQKSGVEPDEAAGLCTHIRNKCPHLRLTGFMTIGAIARSQAAAGSVNEDFERLHEIRSRVCKELEIAEADLELSMGMSADFEAAIAAGSDEVRVGTTIFGDRGPKSEATIVDQ